MLAQGALAVWLLAPAAAYAVPTQTDLSKPVTEQGTGANGTAAPAATPAPAKTAAAPATNQAQPATANTAPQNGTAFVPLTQFPQIQSIATASSLPQFFNTLYKICIGVGSVLAVLMIMYAGVEIMRSSGSVTSNQAAKTRIQNSVLGLILLLAPTIVFGIINPSILNLNFGSEFGGLKSKPIDPNAFNSASTSSSSSSGQASSGQAGDAFTGADAYLWVDTSNFSTDATRCSSDGGTLKYACGVQSDGSGGRRVDAGQQCNAGETRASVCAAPSTAATTQSRCLAYGAPGRIVPLDSGAVCGVGYMAIPHGCCVGTAPTGNICCVQTHASNAAPVQMYQLSAYYTRRNTATNYRCYVAVSDQFVSQSACTSELGAFRSQAAGGNTSAASASSVTVVKSCTATTGANYSLSAPDNLPVCPN